MPPIHSRWRIRVATAKDLAAVLELFDEAVAWLNARGITDQWGTTPVSARPHLVTEVRDYLQYAVVAQNVEDENAELAGFVALNLTVPEEMAPHLSQQAASNGAWVESLVARRTPAARGAGADLLRWAERHALAHGKTSLGLSCAASNPKLLEYYMGRGFERVGELGESDGRSAVFEKRLEEGRKPPDRLTGGCTAE